MISLEDITFAYANQSAIFNHWSWQIQQGEIWCVLGPSGCGKSTLLLLLSGLILPQSGTIRIKAHTVTRPRPGTGLVLQEYGLLPWATVRYNVTLGLRIRNFYGPDGRHAPADNTATTSATSIIVDSWLSKLGLDTIADKFPGEISGGQRQRTAIARALVLNPDILLLDEPFSALDAPTRENLEMLTLMLTQEQGLTVILVTHSIEEAAFVGQNIMLLGSPPHQHTKLINNQHPMVDTYRFSAAYKETVQHLRQQVDI
ncbi:MAG: ATP-binding cassette domain-containing protein [Anaerolineae bacterium]|nr:ATP-binding cassette domain-containing protein [Anaerolineae bacterium]